MMFVDKIASLPDAVYCMLVKGKDMSGADMFAYVAVHERQVAKFKKLAMLGNFHPEKLGKVVYAANGTLTPEMHEKIVEAYIVEDGVVLL